ncbi:MAG TPA: DUF4129 domain-containing protein [Bryobacteraceae bacterium]|nr:DUF4129 domain-containing protein [Bryobacteraceae bacterium]
MRRILLLLLPSIALAATFPNPQSLAAELHRLEGAIAQRQTIMLPDAWEVQTPARHYSIPTAPLRDLLTSPEQARAWIDHLADELGSASPSLPLARQRLDGILARHEFAQAPPPGPFARAWQRFKDWLGDLLLRIFGPVFGNPVTGRVLLWGLGLAAAAFLLTWLWRWFGNRRAPSSPVPEQPAILRAEVSEWLRAARDAAGRGDLRDAIHACYWAGVTHLQGTRLLPEDFTHTPREYLSTVARGESSYPPLAALTSDLERFWYADRPVQPRDFEDALRHLDALGCRAE